MELKQEQLQFLGFIGIFKESIKIILSNPKIFTKLSLAFILPSTILALAFNEIIKLNSYKTTLNYSSSYTLNTTQVVSPTTPYNNNNLPSSDSSNSLILILVFSLVSTISGIIFTTLSTSTVTYAVACIYAGNKEVTFRKVVRVIPKVWKRVVKTVISRYCIIVGSFFVITFVMFMLMIGTILFLSKPSDLQVGFKISTIIMVVLTLMGAIYMAIFWELANVISVMEELCGFGAIKKSKQLIKGNIGSSFAIWLVLSLCSLPIVLLLYVGPKILYVILSLVLSPLIGLYALVVQTMFYFVCKSYHHENINKSTLADHLEDYYLPVKNEVVDIEFTKV